jgi:hypothetical protein
MYSIHKIKAAAAALMVGILLATALTASAQAGNGQDGLTAQQWKAVRARAQATDRYYRVGAFSASAVGDKNRATAADQYYHLGRYAVISTSNPFQWSDAGIGAGTMLGVLLVAGGLAVVLRRRSTTVVRPS